MRQLALDIGIYKGPTLDNYLPGANHAVLQHLRLWLGTQAQSASMTPVPAYLWGVHGSGKTHLLQAVRGELQRRGCATGWLDASVEEPAPFDENWTAVFLDDVHLYDDRQQHAAFNWFVHALSPREGAAACRVLAAGDAPAAALDLRDDLRSRLGWGHVFQLQVLDEAACRAALRQQAEERGVFLRDEVMDFILVRFSRDLGSLMELLARLDDYSLRTRRAITIPMLKSMLEEE